MAQGRRRPDQNARLLADVLSFGWVLPAAIAVGAGLGWLVDRLLGSRPVGLVAFGLLGFGAGLRQLLREASSFGDEEPPPGGEQPPDEGPGAG